MNGELLRMASTNFDVFRTVDRNLVFQQNPTWLPIPVIVIHSTSVRLKDLRECIPAILKIIEQPLSKSFYRLAVRTKRSRADVKLRGAPLKRVPLERHVMAEVTHILPIPMHGLPVYALHPNDIHPTCRFAE